MASSSVACGCAAVERPLGPAANITAPIVTAATAAAAAAAATAGAAGGEQKSQGRHVARAERGGGKARASMRMRQRGATVLHAEETQRCQQGRGIRTRTPEAWPVSWCEPRPCLHHFRSARRGVCYCAKERVSPPPFPDLVPRRRRGDGKGGPAHGRPCGAGACLDSPSSKPLSPSLAARAAVARRDAEPRP